VDSDLSFGRLLRRLRKRRDLTQEGLAQQAACAIDTIKKIEAGIRRPSRSLAEEFADCLGLAGDERLTFLAAARASAEEQRAPLPQPALPQQPTPLVGRAAEISALSALLAVPATRLVTITGPGGIGKTRLALALGEQLRPAERFPNGVHFVPLASLDAAAQLAPTLAAAFRLLPGVGKVSGGSAEQQLIDYLRPKRLLLILDNLEHLLGPSEASDDATNLVATLLDEAPGLTLLATSRERLRLRAERVYPLSGLDVASSASSSSSAVELFVQHARWRNPAFALTPGQLEAVAEICRLVDGMPLAIELAAGWADTVAPSQLAAALAGGLDTLTSELRDTPERHRSIRVVFDASYQRLGPSEQLVFDRLAPFRGGASLAAVQAVSGAAPVQLQALINASLLSYDSQGDRYSLHELLRQYALERLNTAPAEAERAHERHAICYCALADDQRAALTGPEQQAALLTLEAESANIRAASEWAVRQGRSDLLQGMADAMGYFFEWRGRFDEGERAYGLAAAQLEAEQPTGVSIRVASRLRAWQAAFRRLQGDITGAEQLLQGCLALLERAPATLDLQEERAFALLQLGLVASEGRFAAARDALQASLALYEQLDKRWEASQALLWLGDLARYQGNFTEARRHFRASLAIRQACGDRRGEAEVLLWDSHAAAELGEMAEAETLARRSYAMRSALDAVAGPGMGQGELCVILMWAGKYSEARDTLEQTLGLYRELGDQAMEVYAQGWLAVAYLATGQYAEARAASHEAMRQAEVLRGAPSGLAFVRHYAGWVALSLGAYREAAGLLAESVRLHRQTGNLGQLGAPLAQLGYTLWLLGELPRARATLQEALDIANRQHAFWALLFTLPAIALLLADDGRQERAVELYALAWRYPLIANAQSCHDSYGQRLEAVASALPPGIADAARARGQELQLWLTAAALPEELANLDRSRLGF
jgi:predicted ATPase/transcriptional regulator with XRE-family HTH domain